jgi:hypothetical protein
MQFCMGPVAGCAVGGCAATADNGANTYPLEAPDRANLSRRFLGRVVLVRWYIRYSLGSIRAFLE